MKTKIYCTLIALIVLCTVYKVSAQAVAEFNALSAITAEMDLKDAIPELSNILAIINNNAVKISWLVKNEPVSAVYYIEKSIDDETYFVIGTLSAKNDDNKVKEYSFTDHEPSDKSTYYSVRQENKKGRLYNTLLTVEKQKAILPE